MKEVEYIKPNHSTKIPLSVDEDFDKYMREIVSQEQLYSIALFDILGFSNFVRKFQ